MIPIELKRFYEFLRDDLKQSVGLKAYRALFKDAHTYYGYPLGIGV